MEQEAGSERQEAGGGEQGQEAGGGKQGQEAGGRKQEVAAPKKRQRRAPRKRSPGPMELVRVRFVGERGMLAGRAVWQGEVHEVRYFEYLAARETGGDVYELIEGEDAS